MAEALTKTPFKLVTSAVSTATGSQLLYDGKPISDVLSVSVENVVAAGDPKKSRIVIEMFGETEVVQGGDEPLSRESDDGA